MGPQDLSGFLSLVIAMVTLLLSDRSIISRKARDIGLSDDAKTLVEESMEIVMSLALVKNLLRLNRLYALIAALSALVPQREFSTSRVAFVVLSLIVYECLLLALGWRLNLDIQKINLATFRHHYMWASGRFYLRVFSGVLLSMPIIFHWIIRGLLL